MASTATHISIEEYRQAVYEPDCDYVDGELEERAVGELDHGVWQGILTTFFTVRAKELGVRVVPELRVWVSPTRFRVPDVSLLSRQAPVEQVVTYPPLAVFEILSPEDRMTRVLEKLADYEQMQIGSIWVINPKKTEYLQYSSGRLTPAKLFVLPGSQHSVEMSEIAALID